jgi:ParB family chromosome partitioning protein
MATKKKVTRRKKVAAETRGLEPKDVAGEPPPDILELRDAVAADGGAPLAPYRDPLSGRWLLFAALPVAQVAPTPFQRDLSAAHGKRLTDVIDKVGIYLDPIIATREQPKVYWTPNGSHRLHAMKALGARSIVALVVPERDVAYRILALNTEKAHNLKEKSLEVIRMARAMAGETDRREDQLALEFEDPVLLTLGTCYEQNGRFSGGAYRPALKRVEAFLELPLVKALKIREQRGQKLMLLDEKVGAIVAALRERGLESPYLRSFVAARVNPIRFAKEVTIDAEELLEKMLKSAAKFDVAKVKEQDVRAAGGGGLAEEGE